MKILHTSDLHLKEGKKERIGALEEILKIAENEKVDYLTISGDLFDSDVESINSSILPIVRDSFSNKSFKIILIPGNHDKNSFSSSKYYFGENITQITDIEDFEIIDGDIRFIGIPYSEEDFNQNIYPKLLEVKDDKINILLIHCTLDFGINKKSDFGEEEQSRYMPVSTSTFNTLKMNYILAGHFHSKCHFKDISDTCTFIYPGSPVSITSKEEDKRYVVLIDTDNLNSKNKGINAIPIKTFYYKKIYCQLIPNSEEEALKTLEKELSMHNPNRCHIEVILDGYISLEELDFKNKTKKIIPSTVNLNENYRSIKNLMDTDYYRKIMSKLKEKNYSQEEETQLQEVLIRSMSQIPSGDRK